MTDKPLLTIRYRNIWYRPKADSAVATLLPGEISLPAQVGQGTYEPLAVHLNEHGYEFSALYYEHQFVNDVQWPQKWHDTMSYQVYLSKLSIPTTPTPTPTSINIAHKSTAHTIAVSLILCLVLAASYVAIAYAQSHPTYVAQMRCENPTRTITVRSKSKTLVDRWVALAEQSVSTADPSQACKVTRTKR
ncbi:hypothetical protein CPT_Seuss116 [Caulobacter phage Seuss]|uniref:Uncharacterized protein n=1 Tax=Caulobacter phage Seuss TaxID=1675601 RepID=A0A0K1LM91_9CAUD|nr:hypothetical protein HOR08_gp116 [Caulobacter phage Seuss]AKU43642.1 hypothetical protein CPT_Seuss116 [Caulobacter phage Seuss]